MQHPRFASQGNARHPKTIASPSLRSPSPLPPLPPALATVAVGPAPKVPGLVDHGRRLHGSAGAASVEASERGGWAGLPWSPLHVGVDLLAEPTGCGFASKPRSVVDVASSLRRPGWGCHGSNRHVSELIQLVGRWGGAANENRAPTLVMVDDDSVLCGGALAQSEYYKSRRRRVVKQMFKSAKSHPLRPFVVYPCYLISVGNMD